MKERWSTIGGVIAAFFASVCCIGPVVFAALGVGAGATGLLAGVAGFAKWFVPYRPFFIGLTLILLGMGFFLTYRRKPVCEADGTCSVSSMKKNKIILWVVTGIAVILMMMPYILTIVSN